MNHSPKRPLIVQVGVSGKNFTFLPEGDALFLVHWFSPLCIYRVVLPTPDESAEAISRGEATLDAAVEVVYRSTRMLPRHSFCTLCAWSYT